MLESEWMRRQEAEMREWKKSEKREKVWGLLIMLGIVLIVAFALVRC